MTPTISPAAVVVAVVLPVLLVAHTVADHWVQTDHQAVTKGRPGWPGRRACAAHCLTYTATTAIAVGLAWWVLALPISPAGFAAGQLVSALTHYWADRRATLAWLCRLLGKSGYYARPEGAYALDQAFHYGWLLAAALLTALVAAPGVSS
ncbi:MAG: DUF3307 domain-containing protein [Pseudonocardia sp.]|nr:DUF3307 domain-containing protein [Pseudonocardia sp.]